MSKNNRVIAALLLLLLLAGLVGCWLYFPEKPAGVADDPASQQTPAMASSENSAVADPVRHANGSPGNPCAASPAVGADPLSPKPEPGFCRLTIRFVNDEGKAVSGVEFSYNTIESLQDGVERRKAEKRGERKPIPEGVQYDNKAVADERGEAELTVRAFGDFYLLVESPGLCVRNAGLSPLEITNKAFRANMDLRKHWFGMKYEATQTETVVLTETRKILIAPRFDGGPAFAGRVIVNQMGVSGRALRYPREFVMVAGDGQIAFEGLPSDSKLRVTIYATEPGFKQRGQFDFDLVRDGYVLECVIPKTDEVVQGIAVDLNALKSGQSVSVMVLSPAGGLMEAAVVNAPGVWRSRNLTLFKEFRVVVTGDAAWESESISVPTGKYVEVTAALANPVSVKAKIVDEEGKVLFPAVLNRNWTRFPNWPQIGRNKHARCEASLFATAGEDGVATLTGLSPGHLTLHAEAPGFDPARVEVDVLPGQSADAGEIKLKRATGVITVRLKQFEAGKAYRVILMQAGGDPVSQPEEFEDGVARIERVAARRYAVFVFVHPGGNGWSKLVEVNDACRELDLEFDLSVPASSSKR